ncbi:MAG TPA: hypothetical protein VF175_15915 [Lacipirellula sp.]
MVAAFAALATSFGIAAAEEATTVHKPAVEGFEYPLAISGPTPEPVDPPSDEELKQSITRGVDFLIESQRNSGAWGGPQKTKGLNIYAPGMASHLAFRTGTTALAVMSLCEARELFDGERREKVEAAIDRGQTWLLEHSSELTRAAPDGYVSQMGLALYSIWGHAYALHAIVPLHERAEGDEKLQAKLKELAEYHVDRLKTSAFINGGWSYYDEGAHTLTPSGSPFSFATATVLIGLKEAEKLGVEFPESKADKAVASLLRQRYPDFSYAYGEYLKYRPRLGINRPAGSLGRSQVCNLALRMYGDEDVTNEVLKTWLNRLFARNGWLSIGRKRPIPHDSDFGVAGYFYYYGHYYASLCIEELPEEERSWFYDHLARVLMPLQEKDGSWWDYPLYDYHQGWGTAMAVSALVRCYEHQN